MDINDLRSAVTVISLLAFVGIIVWAWSRKNRAAFDEAAQLPFADEQGASGASRGGNQQ
jgi:cytochrome c oxidase cbb3-type subunit 4